MTTESEVRNAPNPQAALLAIAKALDDLRARLDGRLSEAAPADPWGEWQSTGPQPFEALTVESDDGHTDINFARVDPDREQQRRTFAENSLKLQKAYDDDQDWVSAYVKGGPMWLYLADRDLVLQYAPAIRRELVRDVEQTIGAKEAQEMARDILKVPATGQDSGVKIGEGRVG